MVLNQTFELSLILDTDPFQRIFTTKASYLKEVELDGEYIDPSLAEKGITVVYRASKYKKRIRVLANAGMIVNDYSNTDKLIRKLDKCVSEYFNHRYTLDDFTLSGVTLTVDIDVDSREKVSDYLKVLQRIGKVKGFSPISYDCFNKTASFCLRGNSNDTDFLLYDLEDAVIGRLRSADAGRKKIKSVSIQTEGILRAEVRLTKSKAIQTYTDADDISGQIEDLAENNVDAFMETFTRIVPFGDFYKKDVAIEIIRSEIADSIMRRRMLRLLSLIPEKKSLHLAQKAMNCRDVDKVMETFTKISLSPVTISKRHDIKHLENIYSYFLK